MVWRIRATININMNSKLVGTIMSKISFEGMTALRRYKFLQMTFLVYVILEQEGNTDLMEIESKSF